MPQWLRLDSIRLFEASIEALQLAANSLGSNKRTEFRQPIAEYSIEVGLVGASAELAMAACVVQAFGPSAIVWPSGQYKTAGQILSEFRTMVRSATANTEILTHGVADAVQHRNELIAASTPFRRLFPIRAAGLHAGRGVLHEAAVLQANQVADLIDLLTKSAKISPYVPHIPRCKSYASDRNLVIEDIARRLAEAEGSERESALAALYLVLPDIPEEEPEWMDAFDRVAIAPRRRDVNYLMDTLLTAVPVTLRRIAGVGDIVPVANRPQDADAIPIAPQYLRRQFNEIPELWHADVATANGRLAAGSLDLPPPEAVREVFALGLDETGILRAGDSLSAHQSWPFIVSSVAVQGTSGPYWFLVRRTPDLGQLLRQLQAAIDVGGERTRTRLQEVMYGIEAIRDDRRIPNTDEHFSDIFEGLETAETTRDDLVAKYDRHAGTARALPADLRDPLQLVVDGGLAVGELLNDLINRENIAVDCLKYWCRVLADVADDRVDGAALIAILAMDQIHQADTAAKKALRRIDFRLFGPPLESV